MDIETVQQLAPDQNAFKRGKKLASSSKWQEVRTLDTLLFASMSGSSGVYYIQVDLEDVSYKCTCPSRQFPCKHVLALLLVKVERPERIKTAESLPKWVEEWVASRNRRKNQVVEKEAKPVKSPQERKEADLEKWKTAQYGLKALEQWLLDVMKNGLLSLSQQRFGFFDRMTRQLVDAKLPGLANRVIELQELPWQDKPEKWFEPARQIINALFLVCKLGKSPAELKDDFRIELQHFLGWSIKKDDILGDNTLEKIEDNWLVLGVEYFERNNLLTQKTHLLGFNQQKIGYLLDFSFMGASYDRYKSGQQFKAGISFYPGIFKQRGLFKIKNNEQVFDWHPVGFATLAEARQDFVRQRNIFPLLWEMVQVVDSIELVRKDKQWILKDKENQVETFETLSKNDYLPLHLLLYSEGGTMQIAILRKAQSLVLLGAWIDGKYIH